MTVMNLDKLEVWVRAKDIAIATYRDVIPCLPADEKWNLSQQLKRAAQSIPANIAEGMDVIITWITSASVISHATPLPKFKATLLWLMNWVICRMKSITR
jgi:hypothetical protein